MAFEASGSTACHHTLENTQSTEPETLQTFLKFTISVQGREAPNEGTNKDDDLGLMCCVVVAKETWSKDDQTEPKVLQFSDLLLCHQLLEASCC